MNTLNFEEGQCVVFARDERLSKGALRNRGKKNTNL